MVELKLKRTVIIFDFSFFAAVSFFLLTNSGFGFAALCACGLHELSHLIMMIILGIRADKIVFYGAGICISSKETERAGVIKRTLILSAGCIGNIIFAAVLFAAGNKVAAAINLFTALFNILAIDPLDGAQLLKYFVISRCKPENVDRIMMFAKIFSVILLICTVAVFGEFSFYLSAIALYIILISFLRS